MACADCLDNATGYIILSAVGVGLVHHMEITTAALDLESIRLDYLNDKIYVHLSRQGYLRHDECTASFQQNMTTQIQVLGLQFNGFSA